MSTPQQPDRAALVRRSLDARLLFAVLWTVIAAAIYFSLGVVAGYALGLTPVVFLAGGLMFALALMTYVEGASLHQDRAGSTVFARYAFNELWSFIAGWAMLLDYIILLAVCVFAATNYLEPFWSELGEGGVELVACLALLAYVAVRNVRGFSTSRSRRIAMLVVADIAVQLALVVLGLALLFDASAITDSIDLGTTPELGGRDRRARHRDGGLDGDGVRRRPQRRDQGLAARPAARRVVQLADRRRRLCGDRARRDERCAGHRWRDGAVRPLRGRAAARHRRRLRPAVAQRRDDLRDRRRRRGDARRCRQLGDARPVAARLLAVDQPPDTEQPRQAAPDALHAGRLHHARGAAGGGADGPAGHRHAARPLRVRRAAEPDDRARGDHPHAFQGAGPAASVLDPAERERRPRRPVGAAPGGARPAAERARAGSASSPTTAPRAGSGPAGWRSGSRSTSSTASARASRC